MQTLDEQEVTRAAETQVLIALIKRVRDFLVSQNARAATGEEGDSDSACVYIDYNSGRKCAVGCLLKEELITPDINTKYVNTDEMYPILRESGLPTSHRAIHVFKRMQGIHDRGTIACWGETYDKLIRQGEEGLV